MNSQPVAEVKQHEYELLNEIAEDSMVTQANLSDRLGIAVGSVNWYIKRLINRGWVKVSHLDRTRLKYDLTPEWMKVATQRAMSYVRDSLQVYAEYRRKAKLLVIELKKSGITRVYIEGDNEVMDIMRLTCIENEILPSDASEGVTLKTVGQEFKMDISSY